MASSKASRIEGTRKDDSSVILNEMKNLAKRMQCSRYSLDPSSLTQDDSVSSALVPSTSGLFFE